MNQHQQLVMKRLQKQVHILEHLLEHGTANYRELKKASDVGKSLRKAISTLYRSRIIDFSRKHKVLTKAYDTTQLYYVLSEDIARFRLEEIQDEMEGLYESA